MNCFIVNTDGGVSIFNHCMECDSVEPAGDPTAPVNPPNIPEFHSYNQAKENGWHHTSSLKYCPPDVATVWVCPGCWRG